MRTGEGGARTPRKAEIYRCFLVRCRLEGEPGPTGDPPAGPAGVRTACPSAWRFTVQQAGAGGARHSFTCFDDVAAHMRAELASCGALAADDPESTPIARAVTQDRPDHGAVTQDRPYNGAEEHAQTVRRQKE